MAEDIDGRPKTALMDYGEFYSSGRSEDLPPRERWERHG